MNITVNLIRKGWKSASQNGVTVYVRGQAHLGDEYLDTKALAERFLAVALQPPRLPNLQSSSLSALVTSLNGNWAAVVHTSSSAFLAVDHIRSIQLLYSQEGEVFYVFDDVNDFRKGRKLEIDEDGAHEYLSCGRVYSNRTLYKNVYSLQAAEWVSVGQWGKEICSTRYWKFVPAANSLVKENEELFQRVDTTFIRMIRRLIESIGGRKIVVPLSGGYDSRTIVSYLHRVGYRDVLCYSYGDSPDSGQAGVSREIAKRLGYDWHFTKYDYAEQAEAVNAPEMKDYLLYASNGVSYAFFQEYFALKDMLRRGMLKGDEVIVPGYSLDFPAGSCIMKRVRAFNLPSELMGFDKCCFQIGEWRRSYKSVCRLLEENLDVTGNRFYETCLWQEQSAKAIDNSVCQFEWLGFDWRLPEWDREVLELWLSFPERMRYGRRYFISIFDRLADPAIRGVKPFAEMNGMQSVKHAISTRLPYVLQYAHHFLLKRGRCAKVSPMSKGVDVSSTLNVIRSLDRSEFVSMNKRLERNFSVPLEDVHFLTWGNMAIALKTLGMMLE